MSSNILVTGAAGGSIVADFLASNNPLLSTGHIHAAVRSSDQAQALSKLGIKVVQLDVNDEEAVIKTLLNHKIDVVINCANAINFEPASHLITALGRLKETSGKETYYIHTSGLSAFYEKTGWRPGKFKDTDTVFEVEKELADTFPVRKTDVNVIELAKERGVTSFIVIPPVVYGKGTGVWNQLSVCLPLNVKASIAEKTVYKFAEDCKVSAAHISDLTALYGQIVDKILRKEALPNGTEGYYFALAHDLYWHEALEHLGKGLKAKNLVTNPTPQVWPSNEAASKALGVPAAFVEALWNAGDDMIAERPHSIGWRPQWDYNRFLANIDDEIQAVLELGQAKSSLVDSLHKAAA